MSEKKVIPMIVFSCSLLLFFGMSYLFLSHLDFFINNNSTNGQIKIISTNNNKTKLIVSYFNSINNLYVEDIKIIENSYLQKISNNDSVKVIYTKWFSESYIKGIKNPRFLILFFDIGMIFFMVLGIKYGWQEFRPKILS